MLVGLELALTATLALQSARLLWRLVEPTAPLGAAPAASFGPAPEIDLTILGRFDPFFRVSAGPQSSAAAASAEFQLFGVRSDGRGGGSAIIGAPDGRQGSFLVGEDVAPGLVLQAVGADHAILSRGGAKVRLEFASPGPATPAAAPSAPPPPPSPGGSAAIDPKKFLAGASLTPRTVNGQTAGYRVMGRGNSDLLTQAGLQDGDVLLAIEGAPFNAERLSELPELLAQSSEVELRVERAGQILTTRLKMAPR